uniref:Trafficking protein particle complex subunit 13 C-terminal domain-containing protein n=1 Tax=Caenorhabditis japonica TaxID=281687 RepID=A0A8R1HSM4_CAEJA
MRLYFSTSSPNVLLLESPSRSTSRQSFMAQRERSLDLQLRLEQPANRQLIFCSPSGVSLGQLPPSQHVDFSLDIFPVGVGIQSISGIRITDTFTKRIYEHDEIAQIFVS